MPLAGVRVVELGQFFTAPICGKLLAELGADVTKIEPVGGERTRKLPPFSKGESIAYLFANAGKRVVELDLSQERDLSELHDILGSSGVLVENLSAGALHKLGLDPESPGPRAKPGIRCSIRGSAHADFSRDVDVTIQAKSGMAWVAGDADGPQRTPVPVIDLTTATFAALAIVARIGSVGTDPGWCFTVSMLSVAAFLQGPLLLAEAMGIHVPQLGGDNLFVSPNGCYPTSDGFVCLAAVDDPAWSRLCRALGISPQDEHRYATASSRVESRADVRRLLKLAMVDRGAQEIAGLAYAAGIPCAPVRSYGEALLDPEISDLITIDRSRPSASHFTTPLDAQFNRYTRADK
jgi:crotonobetainyl-CoA:carnitine CoA-transferase CaiB-like acyl-CoA transferase